jgi:SpoIID/LytB domain protein
MKLVRIGLTGKDLLSLSNQRVLASVSCPANIAVASSLEEIATPGKASSAPHHLDIGNSLSVSAKENQLLLSGISSKPKWISLTPQKANAILTVQIDGNRQHTYHGRLLISAIENSVRVIVETDLDDYVKGVLNSEMPASYLLEALKAQAVCARTYAMRPRVDHSADLCNVCDSYLCCQCFSGIDEHLTARQIESVEKTAGEILTYDNQPALALFSSCAGGHTENYENCFSDLNTNAFPGTPIPYLKGVPEGNLPAISSSEELLSTLWHSEKPGTVDAWSPHFKWHVRIAANELESHLHHTIEGMLATKDQAPFVIPPSSSIFGHIDSFKIDERGVAGTALTMSVKTSKGLWQFKKELIIRSVFKNALPSIKRLNSARIFFTHNRYSNGLLSDLEIFGLGLGHGVGLQQIGAQGWAKANLNYRSILNHYFRGCQVISL